MTNGKNLSKQIPTRPTNDEVLCAAEIIKRARDCGKSNGIRPSELSDHVEELLTEEELQSYYASVEIMRKLNAYKAVMNQI